MSQKGWLYKNELWEHEALLKYADTYPPDLDYTREMLEGMFQERERGYISPTMLGKCAREIVLKMQTDYYVPLEYAWVMYRGTVGHLMMEAGVNEPDAILEQRLEYLHTLPNNKTALISGTPDKVIPSKNLLIDYKTVHTLEKLPKEEWVQQLSLYKWLLKKAKGISIKRAFIQQVGMKTPRRLEIPLWSYQQAETFLNNDIISKDLVGIFKGTYSVERGILPPVLTPRDPSAWRCVVRELKHDTGAAAWCPVQQICFALADLGMDGHNNPKEIDMSDIDQSLVEHSPIDGQTVPDEILASN